MVFLTLNSFGRMHSSSGARSVALSLLGTREAGLFFVLATRRAFHSVCLLDIVLHPYILLPLMLRWALLWTSCLGVYELVVPWRIWISLMKLSEFFQAAYRKVVKFFFRPVFVFRIVEPFYEVEDSFVISSAVFDRGHYFVDVVFLRLLNVVSLS